MQADPSRMDELEETPKIEANFLAVDLAYKIQTTTVSLAMHQLGKAEGDSTKLSSPHTGNSP